MRTLFRGVVALTVALSAGACTENDPTSVDGSVAGIWRSGIPGDTEATVEFASDGTFRVIDAYFGPQQCSTAAGTSGVTGRERSGSS